MADKITGSSKCVETDNSISRWTYSYRVESNFDINIFCVNVDASEMADPTDASESETLANAKATTIKNAWVATLDTRPTETPVITADKTVTL